MTLAQQIHELVVEPDPQPQLEPEAPKKGLWARFNSIELTPKKVKRKELMHFSRQLSVFITAGIPIVDALETIHAETADKLFHALLGDVIEGLRAGDTFADAIGRHADALPAYYVGILQSAELTGTLDVVLVQLSDYIERDLEARRKVSSALTYPAIIAILAIAVIGVLVVYVLPKFEVFFKSLGGKLPLPTRMLLTTSHALHKYWFVVAGIAVVGLLIAYWMTQVERGREVRDRLVLRIPVAGDLVRHAVLERFCRIFQAMIASGVPLPTALTTVAEATTNRVYRKAMLEVREGMMRGEGISGPMTRTQLFPATTLQMVKVGEQTGSLDRQLEIAAQYYDRELDHKIKRFTGLFEPVVIISMGSVVGFVAIALVTAMYGIYHQVSV